MRRAGMCLLALAALGMGAGCGTNQEQSSGAPLPTAAATTTEPTAIVSDAQVTAGLAAVRGAAAKVKPALAAGGPDAAKAVSKAMYEAWYGFEATVRQNEKDLYLQMEDGLADIQAGARDNKPERIDRGMKDLDEGATAYLGKHP
jgi:hypothetical protein